MPDRRVRRKKSTVSKAAQSALMSAPGPCSDKTLFHRMKPLQRFSAYLGQSILRRLSIRLGIFNPFTSFQPSRSPPAEFTRKKKNPLLCSFSFLRTLAAVPHHCAQYFWQKFLDAAIYKSLTEEAARLFFSEETPSRPQFHSASTLSQQL